MSFLIAIKCRTADALLSARMDLFLHGVIHKGMKTYSYEIKLFTAVFQS